MKQKDIRKKCKVPTNGGMFFTIFQYIYNGVSELNDQKLPDLLKLKYYSIVDAKQELSDISMIRDNFIDFQKYLYEHFAT